MAVGGRLAGALPAGAVVVASVRAVAEPLTIAAPRAPPAGVVAISPVPMVAFGSGSCSPLVLARRSSHEQSRLATWQRASGSMGKPGNDGAERSRRDDASWALRAAKSASSAQSGANVRRWATAVSAGDTGAIRRRVSPDFGQQGRLRGRVLAGVVRSDRGGGLAFFTAAGPAGGVPGHLCPGRGATSGINGELADGAWMRFVSFDALLVGRCGGHARVAWMVRHQRAVS